MKHTTLKIAGMALAIAAMGFTARADVTLSPNVSTYGYVSALLGYNQYPGGAENSSTSLDVNAAKLGFAFNFAPVTAKVSFYGTSGNSGVDLLEANFTYDAGQGWSVTGGRFQSWLGYEPFDVPNCNFITNGAADMTDLIPNFHNGVHVDYAFGKSTVGVAVVDAIYGNGPNRIYTDSGNDSITVGTGYTGGGKLSDGYGVEAHYGYNDGALSIGATAAFQSTKENNLLYQDYLPWKNAYIGDIWAQYIIAEKTTLAAEFYYKKDSQGASFVPDRTQYYGLVSVKQQITDEFSLAGRISTGNDKLSGYGYSNNGNFWKISVTPAFAVSKNLVVAAEINYSKYNKDWTNSPFHSRIKDNNMFAGVLACFHF